MANRYTAACGVLIACLVAAPLRAELISWTFPLSVEQEVPPPTIPVGVPEPSGMATVTFDTETSLLSWNVSYMDLTGPIVQPGAHFHGPADFGEPAGIQVFLTTGDPAEPPSGTLVGSTTIDAMQSDQLLAGLWYINLHTALNPPGEIRGQVVPEPSGALLASLGLLGALSLRYRRGTQRP